MSRSRDFRLRQIGFLLAILVLETAGFYLTKLMPYSWLVARGRDGSAFGITLCIFCMCIALVQILRNRSLLKKAHLENTHGADRSNPVE